MLVSSNKLERAKSELELILCVFVFFLQTLKFQVPARLATESTAQFYLFLVTMAENTQSHLAGMSAPNIIMSK